VHDDDWSISTADGTLSAHFEHTLACLPDGPVVLTRPAATSRDVGREKASMVA
jgi:hypothetical protein